MKMPYHLIAVGFHGYKLQLNKVDLKKYFSIFSSCTGSNSVGYVVSHIALKISTKGCKDRMTSCRQHLECLHWLKRLENVDTTNKTSYKATTIKQEL